MQSPENPLKKILQHKQRFQVLDIFRGIFASFVFLYHLSPFSATPIINNNIIYNADLFVDFFFVLSGFVISFNYKKLENSAQTFKFLRKRFFRIYPLHLFMLILFIGVEVAKGILSGYIHVNNLNNENNNLYSFLLSLFLLNSTPLFNIKDVSWNIPSWSISAEMIAYIVFAFMMLGITRFKLLKASKLLPAFILIISVIVLICITNRYEINYSYNFGFLRAIIGFYTGVICYQVFNATESKFIRLGNIVFSFLEVAALILITIAIYQGKFLRSYGMAYELLFFICIYIFCFEKGIISTVLKKQVFLQNLGKYSYSIYMTHALMISLFNIIFIRILKFPESAYSYLFVFNFIIIYLCSAWTYKNIEMRFYKSASTDHLSK